MRRQETFQAGPLRAALEAEQHTSASARFMHKAHCVLMVMSGMTCCGVAAMFGESARSVARWVRAYEQGGIEGLKNKPHRGRPAWLPASEFVVLTGELSHSPCDLGLAQDRWTGDLLAMHVARQYGVRLGTRQCQRLLRGLRRDTR